MKLKIGDKVKMTKKGFKFYSNIDIAFDMGSVGGKMDEDQFTSTVCELFAIHGVGVVKKFNHCGEAFVKWKFSLDGVNYHYSHYFEATNIKKLSVLENLIFKFKGSL
jgi:hypothetical protein